RVGETQIGDVGHDDFGFCRLAARGDVVLRKERGKDLADIGRRDDRAVIDISLRFVHQKQADDIATVYLGETDERRDIFARGDGTVCVFLRRARLAAYLVSFDRGILAAALVHDSVENVFEFFARGSAYRRVFDIRSAAVGKLAFLT